MDFDRLGLPDQQRADIDGDFLDTTLVFLSQCDGYHRRAWATAGELGDELEAIHRRSFDLAHSAVIDDDLPLKPIVAKNLARLSFINTLRLPSSEEIKLPMLEIRALRVLKTIPPEKLAMGDWSRHRRLFAGLPSSDI